MLVQVVDAGEMRLLGPLNSHFFECLSGAACTIRGVEGTNLRDGSRMLIRSACDATGSRIVGFPRNSRSESSTNQGTTFTWGAIPVTAPGGMHRQPPEPQAWHNIPMC